MSASHPKTTSERTARQVALLGDSTLDNARYVGGEPDVIAVLHKQLPVGCDAVLLAVDGNLITDIAAQLRKLPRAVTHIIVSIGGNDALQLAGLLSQPIGSVSEALELIADVRDAFAKSYRAMLDAVLGRGLPTAICSIYEPAFPDARFRRVAGVGLAALNDVILREAFTRRLPLIDLRLVCRSEADFESVIEPSAVGGAKIAGAIARLLSQATFTGSCSEVFVG
jgi:lysophospholipase L1-like esterase